MFRFLVVLGLGLVGACTAKLDVPPQMLAPERFPGVSQSQRPADYRIGPLDELTINVFQEPDLSIKDAPVDASGNMLLPLIGLVTAEGKTSTELSLEIAQRYSTKYLVNPQVSVLVSRAVSLNVTVDGQVKKPGVFPLDSGRTSLIQALARAEGATETAAVDNIIVLRRQGGQRYAAKFNLSAIQSGQVEDPEILGGDIVIVGTSSGRSLYQDLLRTAPLLGPLFVLLAQ